MQTYLFVYVEMDSKQRTDVPLRSGGKKMKKRRELDALITHSVSKKGNKKMSGASYSHDKLLSASTDDLEDYSWPNIPSLRHRRSQNYLYIRMCGPLFFILTCAFLIGIMYWLYFDIRQQLNDSRQKIEEVSASCKNLPDTLQKWHETSTLLTRNQSAIYTRLNEIQKVVDIMRYNLSNLENILNLQQNRAKDDKLVADFGAKIEAVATDVEVIKDHYNTYIDSQKNLESKVTEITANIDELKQQQMKSYQSNSIEDINAIKSTYIANFKKFQTDLSVVNDTLSQKSKMLHDEIVVHKTTLDDLLDRSENITSHVTTISNSWSEYRQKLSNMEPRLKKVENEILMTRNFCKNIETSVKNIFDVHRNESADGVSKVQNSAQPENQAFLESTPLTVDSNLMKDHRFDKFAATHIP